MIDDHPELLGPLAARRERIVFVKITEAVRFFYEDNDKEVWDWREDYPTIASPFSMAWYESASPLFSADGGKHNPISPRARRMGWKVFCARLKAEERGNAPLLNPLVSTMHSLHPSMKLRVDPTNLSFGGLVPHFMQSMVSVLERDDGLILPLGGVTDYLDEQGKPILSARIITAAHTPGLGESAQIEAAGSACMGLAFAISLAHCKNVSFVDSPVPEKVRLKRERRGLPPKVTYKTLVIESAKRTLRGEGGSGEVGLRRALHICRGHFRSYSETAKLFGRVAGTFWVPQHVRGDVTAGEVVKNYRVAARRPSPEGVET